MSANYEHLLSLLTKSKTESMVDKSVSVSVSLSMSLFPPVWVGRVVVNQEGNLQYSGDSFLIDWTSCLPTTNTHSLS